MEILLDIYFLNFHNGTDLDAVFGTFGESLIIADERASYTQRDITIDDGFGHELARRRWHGEVYDSYDTYVFEDEIIDFDIFGYYGPWTFSSDGLKLLSKER